VLREEWRDDEAMEEGIKGADKVWRLQCFIVASASATHFIDCRVSEGD
jgi:hypothetical protein